MNIVLTTDYFPPHVGGGVEQVTFHLASELAHLNNNVAVVTLNTTHARTEESFDGVQVYRATSLDLSKRLEMQSAVSIDALGLVRRVCRNISAQILHANNLFYFTTIAACASKKSTNARLVTNLHLGSLTELAGKMRLLATVYEKTLGQWVLANSDRVVAVSQSVKQYAENLGVPPLKISLVPNAVDIQKFSPRIGTRDEKTVRVAFIGRLVANKGPQYLVEATQRILRDAEHVEFLVVGNGPMLEQLRARVSRLGLTANVHFMGTVPNIADFLKTCDILVRPSLTEGMPLTVLEAMATGIPTVASRVGGTTEIVHDGIDGFLVEPKNVDELSSKLLRLVRDVDLRRAFGVQARAFVEKSYNWSDVARQMVTVYQTVLED